MAAPDGLYIIPEWIDRDMEQRLVDFISRGQWSFAVSKSRPSQYYGEKYYMSGRTASNDWGPMAEIRDRIQQQFTTDPDNPIQIVQCLVNMYRKKTGIGAHTDKESPLYIFGVSLVNDINMDWSRGDDKRRFLIPRRSLYVMTGEAATRWMHSIPSLSYVYYPENGRKVQKSDEYVRVSVTFRHFHGDTSHTVY